jgi:4-hydroxy-tetrahydrodipicolinate reductase
VSERLLLVGHGRMGQLVESLAPDAGFAVVGVIDSTNADDDAAWPEADVAIDFSVSRAVPRTVQRLSITRTPIVIGTTGWQDAEGGVRDTATRARLGIVAAPNFAIGVNIFLAVAERLGGLMAGQSAFGAWIHELHHAAKKDAPSGTALALEARVKNGGYNAPIPIASTRAGAIPGTHTLGFDTASETITLTHQARDRAAFARGALLAARWIIGKQGWFSMADVLNLAR